MHYPELNVLDGVFAQPIGYGVFDAFRFWCPILTRRIVLGKILRKIRHAMSKHPGAKVSVIAHSFGTYATFKLLNQTPDLRFYRVVLCGSIVSDDYPWDYVEPRVSEDIINDCGTRDIWPAAAKSLTWGYGSTGVFGFKQTGVRDRFHDIDHGGFFDDEFVRTYWVPFIDTGEVVNSPWNSRRPSVPGRVKFLATVHVQWIVVLVVAYLYQNSIFGWIQYFARFIR